jgi:polyhydroxyalkanoate synthesis regulator phasin
MNSDNANNAINLLKKGFHVTLGATSSLVESIQDPIKREENLAQLRMGPNEFAEVLAERGAVTEVEARKFVDNVVAQYNPSASSSSTGTASASPSPSIDPTLQLELQDLTKQLAELRAQLRNSANS